MGINQRISLRKFVDDIRRWVDEGRPLPVEVSDRIRLCLPIAQGERLERFATMLVGDPSEGAELAQEALARVYARWGRIKDGAPGAYARQIVVNLVRSDHRRSLLERRHLEGRSDLETVASNEGRRVDDWLRGIQAVRAVRDPARHRSYFEFVETGGWLLAEVHLRGLLAETAADRARRNRGILGDCHRSAAMHAKGLKQGRHEEALSWMERGPQGSRRWP
jgi:DNA-directed RNA polymerase specialized sigma24 family protein